MKQMLLAMPTEARKSPPSRGRGLKLPIPEHCATHPRRPPRGGVD